MYGYFKDFWRGLEFSQISKTTTVHVNHTFSYTSSPSLHDHDVELLNFTFCRERKHKT